MCGITTTLTKTAKLGGLKVILQTFQPVYHWLQQEVECVCNKLVEILDCESNMRMILHCSYI
ncbi:hypothetical protein F383_16191 [Gossypium arboreum]|uniref:Uncharacterized protein n=1 Tax=Gossypium arboreum TaxID=29729 RepID=A0A0B0NCS0_GOSAR|nr:hypothetical protein F383_16191 [Gossypium arboreum]